MTPMQSTVLFDLDGTLIDTAPDFYRVVNLLLAEEAQPPVSFEFLRSYVSNGARAMVGAAFRLEEEDPDFTRLHQRMLDLYLENIAVDSQLFAGLGECLNWLQSRQIPWGIVTNKPERYTTPLLNQLGLDLTAGTVICPDHVTERKPHPEALYKACTEVGCIPTQSIYVGDHARDIEAGKRAGMHTIAAAYGYLNQGEDAADWQADYLIEQPTELLPLLDSLYKNSTSFVTGPY
ncbi:HAD-IA family hydrolase [Neptuniibacter sp. CAU 1671]|uniref:HAD-IA family hydrolase n=1 Tax=Neptuniibacter sp. CAU 1671 TaxID=3032593 RepID=UPI0023DBF359|nr:HAD-IA family hydrolase [Neptuniibacter sp. CAU 1671]MDF2181494.1 HAD-IA family hydrolase [Neptuniibacter sp. CAU 1671]